MNTTNNEQEIKTELDSNGNNKMEYVMEYCNTITCMKETRHIVCGNRIMCSVCKKYNVRRKK
jgi:hypothetical protein